MRLRCMPKDWVGCIRYGACDSAPNGRNEIDSQISTGLNTSEAPYILTTCSSSIPRRSVHLHTGPSSSHTHALNLATSHASRGSRPPLAAPWRQIVCKVSGTQHLSISDSSRLWLTVWENIGRLPLYGGIPNQISLYPTTMMAGGWCNIVANTSIVK